jgi:hypothetical protein
MKKQLLFWQGKLPPQYASITAGEICEGETG